MGSTTALALPLICHGGGKTEQGSWFGVVRSRWCSVYGCHHSNSSVERGSIGVWMDATTLTPLPFIQFM
jgi:hypothetical protein